MDNDLPNCHASYRAASQEHADVDRRSLNHGSNGHYHTHDLHEADTAELVCDGCLRQRSNAFARNINGDNL